MKRARVSSVWNYFKVESEENKIAKCSICQTKLSFKATVSNLSKHLKNLHSIILQNRNLATNQPVSVGHNINPSEIVTSEANPTVELQTETVSVQAFQNQPSSSTTVDPSIAPVQVEAELAIPSGVVASSSRNIVQQTLARYTHTKKISSAQRKEIDDALMLLFTKDFQPFSLVEDKGFRKFVASLNPAYQLPSRKHISNVMLDAAFRKCEVEVREKFLVTKSACLTVDCWTSRAQEGYFAVTAHYINNNFELESVLLQCRVLPGPHTAINISEDLERILAEWKLEGKVRLVISDNASNMKSSIKALKLKHFGCFAHTLNLVAKSALALPEVETFLLKLKVIISHFRRSTTATEKLLRYQIQNGTAQPKKLMIDVATRWNSTFYMLERALILREALTSTLAILGSTSGQSPPSITSDEWRLCRDLCKVLKPLEEVTVQISGEQYLTGSLVIIFSRTLNRIYQSVFPTDMTLHDSAMSVSNAIKSGLQTRLHNVENSGTLAVSTFLDPRFKNFLFSDKTAAETVKKRVIELTISEIHKDMQRDSTTISSEVAPPVSTTTSTTVVDATTMPSSLYGTNYVSIWDDVDKAIADIQPVQSPRATAIAEVQRYLNDSLLPRQECPNKWWRNHHFAYPNLRKVFQEHGCIIATSVPCERIFSKSGQLISDRRTNLQPAKVMKIMFLNANQK